MDELLSQLTAAVARLTEEVSALAIDMERQNETARMIVARLKGYEPS